MQQRQARALGALLATALLGACDAIRPAPATPAVDVQVEVTRIPMEQRRVWGLTIADFDGDGAEDFLVAGHGGRSLDRIYYHRDTGRYEAAVRGLPRAPDRHGCAAADVDGDDDVDVYCTAGAERGEGRNANELFLAGRIAAEDTPPGQAGDYFARQGNDFGARDEFGRGRLATFLHADDDDRPDLYATVWGPRSDDRPNESSVYLNTASGFEKHRSGASGDWGGRCLVAADFAQRGVDDLVVCHAEEGATFLNNDGAAGFRATALPDFEEWWLALAKEEVDAEPGPDLVALVLDDKGGSIQIYPGRDLARGSFNSRQRLALRKMPRRLARRCIPNTLAAGDVNGDGAADLFVSRVQHDSRQEACHEVEDIILFGPGFDRYVTVPAPANGKRSQVYALNGHFLRVTAGEGWEGDLEVIRLR